MPLGCPCAECLEQCFDVLSREPIRDLPADDKHQAGWQKSGWRDDFSEKDVTLGDLFKSDTPLAHTLVILARLRNTVHGEVIRATMRQSVRSRDAAIRLPDEDEEKTLAAMDALGGREAWGVRTDPDGSAVVDPGLFVERLFPRVLTLLNTVMEHTPGGTGAGPRPPRQGPRWYNERNRLSIRWQLGF